MKKYEEKFKRQVLRYYLILSKDGSVIIDDSVIENVRDLCDAVDVSRFSLYKWRDEIDMTKVKEVTKSKNEIKKEKALRKLKKSQKQNDAWNENDDKDLFEMMESMSEIIPDNDNKLIVRSEIRFYGFLASLFGLKGYSDMALSQLKLKLGLRLIKESGLVHTITE